jgi:rubrerythrin
VELKTAAEMIGFVRKIEDESVKYYEHLAQLYAGNREIFLNLAAESRKFARQIEQAYYGVISDALEGCFAFNVNVDDGLPEIGQAQKLTLKQAIDQAIQMEEKVVWFYSVAAEQSKFLLPDVTNAMAAVARKRKGRQPRLNALQGEVETE